MRTVRKHRKHKHGIKPTRRHRHKKHTTFKKLSCSPKNDEKTFTCFSDADLIKLKYLWNMQHPTKKILAHDSNKIWLALKANYLKICNIESCWVKQLSVDGKSKRELLESFAPKSPKSWEKNPNEWLSTLDILSVMRQYERKYKCFEFLGPSPIDFDKHELDGKCVWDELCKFNLKEQISKGKTKIGIIFNTDPHDASGEHWISMFINIKKGEIFFFDSVGTSIPAEIKTLVDRIIAEGAKLSPSINFKFDQNYPVEHQYGNTECGIYSLYFLVHMLEDKITSHYLKTHIIRDKYVERFRHIYFNDAL